jgi:Domain of unknown function (DUF5658)
MARRISPEGLALIVICTLDALSTYWFLVLGVAREANPLLRLAAEVNPGYFLVVKLLTFLPAIAMAEWQRVRHPQLVQSVLRLALVVYLTTYGALVLPQLLR